VPAELQENGPNDPTTLCIVHSGVNSKLIKYFIYFRLHPWTGRSFENPLRPIHKRCRTFGHRDSAEKFGYEKYKCRMLEGQC
jgi:hypothetical protein